ncbi:aldose 1-epimerase [Radiomyces spectabilis]|uniref:aldose 1-epimerase n=1 Tax=Radiomyces spectabilis TaxID=64574 RepID=UPI00221F4E4B|nr:aldose 1-epimerase [Radiomyces spectabilis]KAI8384423.1 aldose 1-epimerase [Radiomyces spectabilis]
MPVKKLVLSPEAGIEQYTLINDNKTLCVILLNYGGIISHILTPDADGQIRDVVLGYDNYENYKDPQNPYFGALIGRYANRIGGAQFTVDGQEYHLEANNGPNALHGGKEGFDKKIWDVEVLSESPASVQLTLVSPDGDQNYPGTLRTQVTYTVTNEQHLEIEYQCTTDHDTVVNLTNHSYFNLAGVELNPNILDTHVTMTEAVQGVLEVDSTSIPTGRKLSWADAPYMDFTGSNADTVIGARIDQLPDTKGYDHPYVIHEDYQIDTSKMPLRKAVTAYAPETGIMLEFFTTEPTFQFYTGNFIPDGFEGKKSQGGAKYGQYGGFCLESGRNPDAPNKPDWRSSVLLQKGDIYAGKTVFTFKVHGSQNL